MRAEALEWAQGREELEAARRSFFGDGEGKGGTAEEDQIDVIVACDCVFELLWRYLPH